MLTLRDRLEGGIFGLLIGDALGVPYEFHDPHDLPPPAAIEYTPPEQFHRSYVGIPPGTWSDDGAQALVLLASLLDCAQLDVADFGKRLVAWYTTGYFAVDQHVFDVGTQTSRGLHNMMAGMSAHLAGTTAEQTNGNGALMRVLPLALWHQGDDRQLVIDAQQQSLPTHGHLRSQVCCALYCLWARRTLQGVADPWRDAVATLRLLYANMPAAADELEQSIRPDDLTPGQGSGYVVDCLRSARWAVEAGTYEQVVKAAIGLGHDTDTTACVAGGIAGIRDGIAALPERWQQGLRAQELVTPLLQRLLQSHGL